MKLENRKYSIFAGLGGSGGGAQFIKTVESNLGYAELCAYVEACGIYESYEGMYGSFNYEDALEENPELSEEELNEMYREDMESWIEYYAKEYEEGDEDN